MEFPSVVWNEILNYLQPKDMKNLRLTRAWSGQPNDSPILQRLLRKTCLTVNSVDRWDLFKEQVHPSLAPKNIKLQEGADISEFANDPNMDMDIKSLTISCQFTYGSLVELLGKIKSQVDTLNLDFTNFLNEEIEENEEEQNGRFGFKLKKIFISNYNIERNGINGLNAICRKLQKMEITNLDLKMDIFLLLLPNIERFWKSSLKFLRIEEWDHKFLERNITFPYMEKLERLVLISEYHSGGLHYSQDPNFKGSLGILKNMPLLKILSLQITSFPNVFPPPPEFGITSKLESLQVVQFALPPNLVPQMATNFPFLKRLDIFEMSNAALAAVCQHLSTLEVLRLGSGTTDLGITGLPSNQAITKARVFLQQGKTVDSLRKKSFIGSLTRLKRITIVSRKITDAAIEFGLVHCTKLQWITIERPVLSDASLNCLADSQLPLQKLEIYVDGNITEVGANHFKEKHPKCIFYPYYFTQNGMVRNVGLVQDAQQLE